MLIHTIGIIYGISMILFSIVYYNDARCILFIVMGIVVIVISYVGKRDVENTDLCPVGFSLWNECWAGDEWSTDAYNIYRKHIISCHECRRRLNLSDHSTELIRKDIEFDGR